MAILSKYESFNVIGGIEYISFACGDEDEMGVEAIQLMKDDSLPSGETLWCVGNVRIPREEIDRFAVAPETDDDYYSTQGWSVACETFDEMIDELRECNFEEFDEMEECAREFFGV